MSRDQKQVKQLFSADTGPSDKCTLLVCRSDSDEPAIEPDDSNELIQKCRGKIEVVFVGVTKMIITKYDSEKDEFERSVLNIDNRRVSQALRDAAVALLIFGGQPSGEFFPWHPFIAGFLDGRYVNREQKGRYPQILCRYAKGYDAKQIKRLFQDSYAAGNENNDIDIKEATAKVVREDLINLLTDKDYSHTLEPLNRLVEKSSGDKAWLTGLSEHVSDGINGLNPDNDVSKVRYGTLTLQLALRKDDNALEESMQVRAHSRHLSTLFGIEDDSNLTWGEIDKALQTLELKHHNGDFRGWIGEINNAIPRIRRNRIFNQLTGGMIGSDGHVYRPQIQRYEIFESGRIKVNVNFSRQTQDTWLVNANEEIAVAYNLTIAARIRHDIVGNYRKKIASMSDDDWNELDMSVKSIAAEGFFFRSIAGHLLNAALGKPALDEMDREFGEEVWQNLNEGIIDKDGPRVDSALKEWAANNQKFFNLALPWYSKRVSDGADN